ncbi:uncharacterized protein LOC127282099 [Leptopilina boulardi]|uniref:uncharacterized protein LOC127282099 n=1 Tax=Leptopilina boulardi TaxID=63433 RepID=UPI0021F68189|nr:uncharacterized protein LOC127282099 [Leptopilina boulardi]
MENNEKENFVLFDSFIDEGWFYIVNKTCILVTEKSEIKIGAKMQFSYPNEEKTSKIKTGKIIMQSESIENLEEEMNRRIKEIKVKKITREELKEKEKSESEAMKTKFMERARQDNIIMAKELQKDINLRKKEKDDLLNKITSAINLTKKENEKLENLFI